LNITEETARGASTDEVSVATQVKEKQHYILNRLVEKLGPD